MEDRCSKWCLPMVLAVLGLGCGGGEREGASPEGPGDLAAADGGEGTPSRCGEPFPLGELRAGTVFETNGNTDDAPDLIDDCTACPEHVYELELAEPRTVTVRAGGFDVALGLYRSPCGPPESRVVCANERSGGEERLRQSLDAGTYYLMVSGDCTGEYGLDISVGAEFPSATSRVPGGVLGAGTEAVWASAGDFVEDEVVGVGREYILGVELDFEVERAGCSPTFEVIVNDKPVGRVSVPEGSGPVRVERDLTITPVDGRGDALDGYTVRLESATDCADGSFGLRPGGVLSFR